MERFYGFIWGEKWDSNTDNLINLIKIYKFIKLYKFINGLSI